MNEMQAVFRALAQSRTPAEVRRIRTIARVVVRRWRIEPGGAARELTAVLHAVASATSVEELAALKRRWAGLLSSVQFVRR